MQVLQFRTKEQLERERRAEAVRVKPEYIDALVAAMEKRAAASDEEQGKYAAEMQRLLLEGTADMFRRQRRVKEGLPEEE